MNLDGTELTGIGSHGRIEHVDLTGQPIELTEENKDRTAETVTAAGGGLTVKATLVNTT